MTSASGPASGILAPWSSRAYHGTIPPTSHRKVAASMTHDYQTYGCYLRR